MICFLGSNVTCIPIQILPWKPAAGGGCSCCYGCWCWCRCCCWRATLTTNWHENIDRPIQNLAGDATWLQVLLAQSWFILWPNKKPMVIKRSFTCHQFVFEHKEFRLLPTNRRWQAPWICICYGVFFTSFSIFNKTNDMTHVSMNTQTVKSLDVWQSLVTFHMLSDWAKCKT